MKWLQEHAFPDKTPQEIIDHAKHPDFGLYPAVTHEARDVLETRKSGAPDLRRVVNLGKTERDIGHSLHNMPNGKKPEAVVNRMRAWVDDALNRFGFTGKVVVDHRENFPEHLVKSAHPGSEAFIDPKDGAIYIDAGKHSSYADAIFTAFHEAFHRGELGSEVKPYADALIRAGKNKTVRAIADKIKATYEASGKPIPDAVAVREALADIHGAQKTGRWDELKVRNGSDLDVSPLAKAQAAGMVRRVIDSLKGIFNKMLGRGLTDREVLDLVDNTFRRSGQEIKTGFKGINEAVGKQSGEDIAHSLPSQEGTAFKFIKKGLDKQLLEGKLNPTEHAEKVATAKKQFEFKQELDQQHSVQNIASKVLELAKDTSRAFKLSGLLIAPKLLGAVAWKVALSPAEQAVISALRVIPAIDRLAQGAKRYGGFNSHAEWEAFKSTFSADTIKQMWQAAKKGNIDIDKFREMAQVSLDDVGNEAQLDRPIRDFVTRLHAALKTPLKINEFTRSSILRTQSRIAELIADGKSPREAVSIANSGDEQAQIGMHAYIDAQRAVMLGNNKLHEAIEKVLKSGKESDSVFGKTLAHGTELMLPVRKVPLNIGAEALEYGAGGLNAAGKLIQKGSANLTSDERDYVLRNLSKQTLGIAIGYLAVKGLIAGGGYYTDEPKKDYGKGQISPLEIALGGSQPKNALAKKLLSVSMHTPALDIVQAIGNYQKLQKRGESTGGAAVGTGLGFAEEHAPLVQLAHSLFKAVKNKYEADKFIDNTIKGFIIPGAVSSVAEIKDKLSNPDVTDRRATDLKTRLQKGIPAGTPFLPNREQLPAYRD